MKYLILIAFVLLWVGPVEARHRAHHHVHHHVHHKHLKHHAKRVISTFAMSERIVEHPIGCPWRAFCACGLSVRFFGRPIPDLMAARSWYRFRRAPPAPETVAVSPHHVFELLYRIEGDVWMVYDANSGRHMTRVHARSIAGYAIVNPRG